jgi:hypothetical protein
MSDENKQSRTGAKPAETDTKGSHLPRWERGSYSGGQLSDAPDLPAPNQLMTPVSKPATSTTPDATTGSPSGPSGSTE